MSRDPWLKQLRTAGADPRSVEEVLAGDVPADGLQHAGSALLRVERSDALVAIARRLVEPLGHRGWTGDAELIVELEHYVGRTASDLTTLPVALDELGEALDQSGGSESFIDLTDGTLWPAQLFDVGQGPPDFDPASDRWLLVVGLGSGPAYNAMQRFVATIEQPDRASRLTATLDGPGAFRRFQTELNRHEDEYTRWHRFREDDRLGRARCWLANHGVQRFGRHLHLQRVPGQRQEAPRDPRQHLGRDRRHEQIVIDTLESTPKDATHWSTRSLAAKHGISHQTVSEIWRAFGLKPWQQDEFKISPDPQLAAKIRDIVGLYMNPPVNAAVFAVDEKPQIQALNRTAPMLPMMPTTAPRRSHDYQRNGTIDLFAALDIATGRVITDLRPNHTSKEFIKFLNKINREVPAELDVHVVLDNLSTHKTPADHKWLLRHRRFHFHFTPTYGSWMNLVERWFSALTTKKLQRSAHDSVNALAADIIEWVEHWNENPTPFVWHKTADEILQRIGRYCADLTNNESSTETS